MSDPRPGSGLMGWCMTFAEDHEHCRTSYVDWAGRERTCSCPCHTAREAVSVAPRGRKRRSSASAAPDVSP